MPASTPRPFGVFCPVSAFPSRFGIGDFGDETFRFVDWLVKAGASSWQVLPLTIPDSVGSPYASPSNLAGNWALISPERLAADGWLRRRSIPQRAVDGQPIDHRQAARTKMHLLFMAFTRWRETATTAQQGEFHRWQTRQGEWLRRYVLYQAIKDRYLGQPWWRWSARDRSFETAAKSVGDRTAQRMEFHAFCQWVFYRQWQALKSYAHDHGISIIGDLPFSMPLDSAVVWAQPELFLLDRRGRPTKVAGVPPDAFSAKGQRWGSPVYRWAVHRRTGFRWWADRIEAGLRLYDYIRFDHFRGLVSTWHIPAHRQDAVVGHWVATPGSDVLRAIRRRVGRLPIIAEDLGMITPDVNALRRKFRLPGVRVLEYAWSGLPHNPHHPDAVTEDTLYYTSTHDTNTLAGWWRDEAKPYERAHVRRHIGRSRDITAALIQVAARTRAKMVIVPLADALRLGAVARINTPGTKRGNWSWRLRPSQMTSAQAKALRALMTIRRQSS